MATLMRLRDAHGDELDQALVLWFPAPRSYTGEDCVELHLHGGPAVVDATISSPAGARAPGWRRRASSPAGPSRTASSTSTRPRRSADLVDAETARPGATGARQLGGALGRRYDGWRELL